ncbi:ABC transporter ATP-binding protein [Reyranella sp.]|uniref:ABC transporter ATP-binding protein n=1 Tax=Reyranella sp. TaxID=1929291 RepID=UPI003BABFAA0
MSDVVVKAIDLSKKFVIGHKTPRGDALAVEVIARRARNLLRKSTDLAKGRAILEADELEEFWALRDVSFEVRKGEVVSIIGHNGAGKTTLLKILARITEPSAGRVLLRGRVASLLEIGTGFHPELSGRENIFLNGAILGMKRHEVSARFDDIVEFAGISKFLDTPVKRYSVGMYARLAFAVAAHLETEILFVDEVLAVGDAEFQQRCLDRMSKVASEGRTVLFVSHNLAAAAALTRRGIVLNQGQVIFDGPIETALAKYTASLTKGKGTRNWGRGDHSTIHSATLVDENGLPVDQYVPGTPFRVCVDVETSTMPGLSLELKLRDQNNIPVAFYSSNIFSQVALPTTPGRYLMYVTLQPLFLASGDYSFDVLTNSFTIVVDHGVPNAIFFSVPASNPSGMAYDFKQSLGNGTIALQLAAPLQIEGPRPV